MTTKNSYWGQVWQAGHSERDEHLRISPSFGTQAELLSWLSPFRTPGYRFRMIRRESDGASYKDVQLVTEEPMSAEQREANKTRLMAMLRGSLDKTAMPEPDGVLAFAEDSEPF